MPFRRRLQGISKRSPRTYFAATKGQSSVREFHKYLQQAIEAKGRQIDHHNHYPCRQAERRHKQYCHANPPRFHDGSVIKNNLFPIAFPPSIFRKDINPGIFIKPLNSIPNEDNRHNRHGNVKPDCGPAKLQAVKIKFIDQQGCDNKTVTTLSNAMYTAL